MRFILCIEGFLLEENKRYTSLTHYAPKFPPYGNQSIDLQSKSMIGFYMMATLAFNKLTVMVKVLNRGKAHHA